MPHIGRKMEKSKAPIEPPDLHFLNAAEGWLELGDAAESEREWQRVSRAGQEHPAALSLRWKMLAQAEDWDGALLVADRLVDKLPGEAVGWLHRAYAARRATEGGLRKAWNALHPAADLFPDEYLIAYNLACYATQLSRPDEGWEWFLRAVQVNGNVRHVCMMALMDGDLEPLWTRIREFENRSLIG